MQHGPLLRAQLSLPRVYLDLLPALSSPGFASLKWVILDPKHYHSCGEILGKRDFWGMGPPMVLLESAWTMARRMGVRAAGFRVPCDVSSTLGWCKHRFPKQARSEMARCYELLYPHTFATMCAMHD